MDLGAGTETFVHWKEEKSWKTVALSLFCFESWPVSFRGSKYNCWWTASFQDPATSHLTLLPATWPCYHWCQAFWVGTSKIFLMPWKQSSLLTFPKCLLFPSLPRVGDWTEWVEGCVLRLSNFDFLIFETEFRSVFILLWGLVFFFFSLCLPHPYFPHYY